jgi:hypothetical protein
VKVFASLEPVARRFQILHLLQATVESILLRHEFDVGSDLSNLPTLNDSYTIGVPNRRQAIEGWV